MAVKADPEQSAQLTSREWPAFPDTAFDCLIRAVLSLPVRHRGAELKEQLAGQGVISEATVRTPPVAADSEHAAVPPALAEAGLLIRAAV